MQKMIDEWHKVPVENGRGWWMDRSTDTAIPTVFSNAICDWFIFCFYFFFAFCSIGFCSASDRGFICFPLSPLMFSHSNVLFGKERHLFMRRTTCDDKYKPTEGAGQRWLSQRSPVKSSACGTFHALTVAGPVPVRSVVSGLVPGPWQRALRPYIIVFAFVSYSCNCRLRVGTLQFSEDAFT